jgi:ribosomal subunit interface protein
MALQITGKNIEVGEAYQEYVRDKVEQVVGKYIGLGVGGHVRLEKERSVFRTECSIHLRSGLVLQSSGEAPDAYASADACFEHLEKRVRRHKRRLTNHHHGNSHGRKGRRSEAPDYLVEARDDEAALAQQAAPVIIAETRRVIREVAVSDAVMELDVSNEPFLVFRNPAHGGLNLVYRRADGNVGWIDPETTT